MVEGISPAGNAAESDATLVKRKPRRGWQIALGGTAVAAVATAGLMQVWRGEEGVAAEAPAAGKATVAQAPVNPTRPRHLARVGDAVITYEQVADEAMARHGEEVLDQLVNRTIIELACRERGVTVYEAEVEQEITTIAQEFGLDRAAWMQMLQAERNISPAQYRRDVIWPMIALKKLAGTDVQLTEADVQKAFERDFGARVKARMIMGDNIRRMQEVWQKANDAKAAADKEGGSPAEVLAKTTAEFGRLAREYSMEPTSKSLDGSVPPIRRHTGQESLEQAAFGLRPGEISGIVQLPLPGAPRYVILMSEGQTEPVVRQDQIDLVREDIVTQLKKEKVQESVASLFTKLREKTEVHNFLTNTSTGGVTRASGEGLPSGIRPTAAVGGSPYAGAAN